MKSVPLAELVAKTPAAILAQSGFVTVRDFYRSNLGDIRELTGVGQRSFEQVLAYVLTATMPNRLTGEDTKMPQYPFADGDIDELLAKLNAGTQNVPEPTTYAEVLAKRE